MPSTSNKQTVEEQKADEWALTVDNLHRWLLGLYEKQKQVINDAKKKVKETETEVDPKVLDELLEQNLSYNEESQERRNKQVLKLAINPRTNKLWDVPTLQGAGKLGDAEVDYLRSFYNGKEPPFYYITQIERRMDDQHKEWLIVQGMVELLDKDGTRVNESLRLGFHNIPQLQWRYVPSNPRDSKSEQIRIPQHNWRYFVPENSGQRIYNIPYSKETFFALMQHVRSQDPTDKHMGVALTFYKVGTPNPITVKSIEQFTGDFEEEWEKLNAPPVAKDLENFVKEFKKQNQTQYNKAQADLLRELVAEFRRQSISEAENNAEHYK
jgi:hypothetical protein